jgi:hypothetical protein
MVSEKKYGTPLVLTQWIIELGHLTSIGPRIQKTRDILNITDSLMSGKSQADIDKIDDAIKDIEKVRSDYRPDMDHPETFLKYYDEAQDLGKRIDDILRPVFKIITVYDLIDPSGIMEGKAKSWGSVKEKER